MMLNGLIRQWVPSCVWRFVAVAFLGLHCESVLADDGVDFFEAKIRPVLVQECYQCHAADGKSVKGGLLLDHQAGLLEGGDSGPAVVPGNVDASLLISALRHDSFEMPPKGRLDDSIIDDFVRWVEMGAPDPRKEAVDGEAASQAMSLEEAREFWAFQSPMDAPLPTVKQLDWPKNAIDYFVLSRLESAGLPPVRPATKREWIRRATFDLIGLPPTPTEIDAFLGDDSSEAYENVIQRLLDSPHYGERWGRFWLDVARYAEDQAHTFAVKPSDSGFRYRDWVVDAFNRDVPFDQFVKLQIAADLMELDEEEKYRDLPALGFFGLGAQYYKNSDAEKARADELDDRVDTLTRGFLGLTVSCARCHDHKYDPIPTQDYYSLAGVFQSSRLADQPLVPADVVAAYNDSQKRLKDAEELVKTFIVSEKEKASEAQANRLADYLLVASQYRRSQESQDPLSIEALASKHELSQQILQRFIEALKRGGENRNPALKDWYALHDVDSVDEPSLIEMARSLQTDLLLALDIRAGRYTPVADKTPAENETKQELGKPRYGSPMVTKQLPLVDMDVDLTGAQQIYLVVSDAGNGKSCDHADWIEPRFIKADGEIKLTDLKWKSLALGFGSVNLNKNVSGGPLKVGGMAYKNGLGTHAPSVIVYDIPEGATRFVSRAGLDNGGSDQGGCGEQASIQFRVYTERPNDFDQIMNGEVKPDQGVLSQEQVELVRLVYSKNAIFSIDDDHLVEILPETQRAQWTEYRAQLEAAKKSLVPKYAVAHVIADAKPTDLEVFIRGNPARRGEPAPRRFLRALSEDEPKPFTQGSGRLELANAIASDENSLTARVMVNRVWQQHFGRGLVATPSNFGTIGQRPTHPELLDHLAIEFVRSGWSIKSLHRKIMLSATYRLSADNDALNAEVDADNALLWRMNRRRLDVEAWRDALLAVSGRLDSTLGGPSTDLDAADNARRTIYGKVSRHELNSLLRLFDFPDANITSERRTETTVPQQQLFVLNSPFMVQQAQALSTKLFDVDHEQLGAAIQQAYRLLYGREATDAEIQLGLGYLNSKDKEPNTGLSRKERYAQALLGSNEFTFID